MQSILSLVEALVRDLRYAVRALRRDAALTTFAILIIGVGVGASTIVFSVVNALWLRPLPFDEPGRLVWVANGTSENLSRQAVQVGHLVDLRQQSQSLVGLAGFSPFYGVGDIRLTGTGEAERVTGVPVTEGFFPLLGVRPWLGRDFTAEECLWGAPRTAILSYAFWQRRLRAKADVIGEPITLDGAPVTIVGVLPPSFDFGGTFSPGRPADLFLPFPLSSETNRRGNTLAVIGRLRPGIDVRTAAIETATAVDHISRTAPDVEPGRRRNLFRPNVSPLQDRISGRFHGMLAVLAAAVGFLMLLVSANISNLLLARASARHKEMALRMALGAGRERLVRQLLVESLVLSCGGATLGLALAVGGTILVANLEGASIPLLRDVRVDGLVIVFVASVAMLTGICFGVLPALQASGSAPQDALKGSGRGATGGGGWMRRAIVVAEIVLVSVLLTGAGLLTRSLSRVLDVDPGFTSENVISLRVDPSRLEHPTLETRNAYFDAVLQHVRSVPGVETVGLTDALPLGDNFGWRGWTVSARDRATDPGARANPLVRMIDASYFSAMRIAMKAGRGFTSEDHSSSERVVIINEALGRALWPGEDPLGRVLRASGRDYRVIGIVNDVRYFALERDTGQEMYMLLRQTGDYQTVDLIVRSAVPPVTPDPRPASGAEACRSGSAGRRVPNHGPTRGSVGIHQADHREVTCWIRRLRTDSGGAGTLCRHLVLGEPANAGNRHPHGTWRRTTGHATADSDADDDPRGDRPGHRPSCCMDGCEGHPRVALRCCLVGPSDVRRCRRGCRDCRRACRLCARDASVAHRPRGGSAIGMSLGQPTRP